MKDIRTLIILTLTLLLAAPGYAVTKEEMEKARVTSAKIYLRWANNGSDYLESLNPSTLSELEGKLREKEKNNIKAFKAIPVPQDYATWDKAKLVEYWSKTALATSGLNADGVRDGAKKQIRSKLQAMNVSAPEEPKEEKEPAAAAESAAEAAVEVPALPADDGTEDMVDSSMADSTAVAEETAKGESSSTWIYILALALLVIAVVALVVYASKTMNGDKKEGGRNMKHTARNPEAEERPVTRTSASLNAREEHFPEEIPVEMPRRSEVQENTAMREKFSETLARKQEEIRSLNRQLSELQAQYCALSDENVTLRLEADRLRAEKTEHDASAGAMAAARDIKPAPEIPETPRPSRRAVKEIYLGRVNAKGLFVRADRNFVAGSSLYALSISDDYSGSFRVVRDKSVYDLAFSRPEDMLGGGCVAEDLEDTDGARDIITESAGTAVFENNCWRVVRKARIRYE